MIDLYIRHLLYVDIDLFILFEKLILLFIFLAYNHSDS